MDTKEAFGTSGVFDEFAKFAQETAKFMRERGVELESNMAKVMGESGKPFMKFAEGTKLGKYIEANPSRAAMFALMTGMMFTHMMKSRGVNMSFETGPEAMKSGDTSKPKTTAKAKAA